MTDLDTLRRSLAGRPPAEYGQQTLDVAQIMTRGRRLRIRRRVTAAGGARCVAVAVFGAGTGVSYLTGTPPAPGQQPASSTRIAHSPSPAVTFAGTPEPSARPVPSAAASPQDASPGPAVSSPSSSPDPPTSIPAQRPGDPSAQAVPSAAR